MRVVLYGRLSDNQIIGRLLGPHSSTGLGLASLGCVGHSHRRGVRACIDAKRQIGISGSGVDGWRIRRERLAIHLNGSAGRLDLELHLDSLIVRQRLMGARYGKVAERDHERGGDH